MKRSILVAVIQPIATLTLAELNAGAALLLTVVLIGYNVEKWIRLRRENSTHENPTDQLPSA